MITLELTENDQPRDIELPHEVGIALATSGVVSVSPTLRSGVWKVSPGRKVGVVALPGVEVRIAPKTPVRRLLFLLGYSRNPKMWREVVALERADDLVAAVAQGFIRQAETALRQGVLHGYREQEEALTVVRGRIMEKEQVGRRFGLPLPVEVRYDEFTADIAENRILRTAARTLLGVPRVPRELGGRLRRLVARLEDARFLYRREPRPAVVATRLNARYRPALHLAELILDGASMEHGFGEVRSNGFLLDVWRVFEDFVGVALREALGPRGGAVELQTRGLHLDVARDVTIRPDIVWRRQGEVIGILDAKYKVEAPGGFPDADLYQMLAYCTALGVPRGHLLYARGLGPARHYQVRNSETEIRCHSLDLDQEPEDLLLWVDSLATTLASETV